MLEVALKSRTKSFESLASREVAVEVDDCSDLIESLLKAARFMIEVLSKMFLGSRLKSAELLILGTNS